MSRNKNKPLNVRCQFCDRVCKTKTLEMELLCEFCGKWAKYRNQKVKAREIFDRSNKFIITVYEVVKKFVKTEEITN